MMLKKFLLSGVIAGTLLLAASSSFAPSDAAAIHPNQGLASASAESGLVDLVRRYRLRRTRAAAGIGVFIVPGLYWGPAWWDPIYARVCWKPYRPCRNCAQNWIYVC
jgi:hypothetical protein